MKPESNLGKLESRLKMGDEGWGTFKERIKVLGVSITSIIKILSTRLLIHSVSSVLHYGSLWGI
jgi:hypothetical protein